ncbi:acetyltransferase [Solitalea koreensis]|uniref:Sugar O-acyltransferase, sialic acid O-acetyltransferase NeuD family n=1 Tax=Solitalea koreensis TaxID=543615 RepID=A0A521CNS9_9SPHI|nr:acetyltransferase [Solitalea koreensis]SMO61109.1 sugar O-acyltransferase, sialic acid O-acetyltransferase NeuD family [Solitalea koreensis]
MKKEAILIGYSGHGYVVADALICAGYSIKGYLDTAEKENNPYKLVYLGTEDSDSASIALKSTGFVVAVGNNAIRKTITEKLIDKEFFSLNIIHPSAIISGSVKMGTGVMVMAGVVVNPFAEIGDGVILNTNCTIEHECKIGSYTHIAPGVVLAGNVTIGENVFVGANSVIKQGVTIGNNVIIGAGTVIIRNIPDGATVVGNPGRIIK